MRLASFLVALCTILAASAPVSRADDTKRDDGERIRAGILNYLTEIRDKKGELTATEARVKEVLGTDARLKDLKAAKIVRDGDKVKLDVWEINTKSGSFSVLLTNRTRTAMLIFEGSVTPIGNDGPYRLKLERMLHAHGK